jgi:hypothetical protein
VKVTGKRLLLATVVLVAGVSAYLLVGRSDNALRLRAQVSGTADAAGAGYRAGGTGSADAPFGSVTLSAAGSGGLEANCVVFDGSGELATAAGTLQLRLAKPGKACIEGDTLDETDSGGPVQVSGKVEAIGTSGSLVGRHGSLEARGSVDTSTGAFTVLLSGRLHR